METAERNCGGGTGTWLIPPLFPLCLVTLVALSLTTSLPDASTPWNWLRQYLVKTLEPLLRVYEKDEGLIIENAEEEPGSNVGDNYMSIVVRTKVTGTSGNGAPYRATFMTKRFPRHRHMVKLVRNADLFFNEAHAYTKLLPRFGSIAPRCVYADGNDIIMEDLRALGYVVCERRNLLDLQHCQATVKTLAVLHARSLTLKLQNPSEFGSLTQPLLEAVFPQDDGPSLGLSVDSSLSRAIKHLSSIENPDEELSRALSFLKSYENRGYESLRVLVARGKEKYDVLTHGDAWNNNIVFKHDESGRVTDVKLIDFQIVRHCSPAVDFHYFVYSSARASVIDESYDDLVQTYHKELAHEMRRLGANEDTLRDLSLEWFKAELKKMSLYGLVTSLWLVNAVLAEDDEIIDMDLLTPQIYANLIQREDPLAAAKRERMEHIIRHYCRTYVITE